METLQLHDLVKEVQRSMQFFSCKIGVETFDKWLEINAVIVDRAIIESSRISEIEMHEMNDFNKIFKKKVNVNSQSDEEVNVNGKLLVLTKEDGFIEIDVNGHKRVALVFVDDIQVNLKDPVRRDIVYVSKNYPGVFQKLLDSVKKVILINFIRNPRKLYNLSRIIDFINKIDSDTECSYFHKDAGRLKVQGDEKNPDEPASAAKDNEEK